MLTIFFKLSELCENTEISAMAVSRVFHKHFRRPYRYVCSAVTKPVKFILWIKLKICPFHTSLLWQRTPPPPNSLHL